MAKILNWFGTERTIRNSGLIIFSPLDLKRVLRVSEIAVRFFLTRYVKKGALVKLRSGFYALSDNMPSEFEIANALYRPSYISLTFALAYHHIIPETTYTVTSVTTRPTARFEVMDKEFRYHRIKRDVFTGYIPEKIHDKTIFIADREKALVDYFYFVSRKIYTINSRIDTSRLDKKKMRQYSELFHCNRLNHMIKEINA